MPHTDRVPRIARAALLAAALIANAAPAAAETGKAIDLPSGASIYFETHGAGRPLLAIHGGLDHTYFRPWLDPLAKNFQLVLPDVRGNGRSQELPEAEYTHEKMIADFDALRTALGFREWAVLGHSYGGYLAQLCALKYPDTVSYLVLVGTSPARRQLGNKEGVQLAGPKMTPAIRESLARLGSVASDDEWKRIWHTILPLYFHQHPVDSLIANDKTIYGIAC